MRVLLTICCRWKPLFVALIFAAPQAAHADKWHDHGEIREAVAAAMTAEFVPDVSRVDVVVDEIDHRVRLPDCDVPLAVSLPYGRKQAARMTAEVRCAAEQPWKIYVPARLTVYHRVVIASRPLSRDTILTADDIKLTEQATGVLGYGYLLNLSHAVGHQLRRPISAGKVLTPAMLTAPKLVKRGQRVNLQASTGTIDVRMAGVARSDGIRGQVIDVENLNSGRLVQAIVRSAKSVEVLLQ